jgi:hypothetical protein
MISKYSHKSLVWTDLESPKEEEISHIIEEYSIPKSIEEEIKNEFKDDIINIDYDFIFIHLENIIFIVNDNFVLTIHPKPIPAFFKFSKELELDIATDEKLKINTHKLLFAYLLKSLYKNQNKDLPKNLPVDNQELQNLKIQLIQKNKKLKLLTSLLIIFFTIIVLIFLYVINYI